MTDDQSAKKQAGPPATAKPAEGERFDLFRTFRHPYKPGEPVPQPKPVNKPKR